MLSYNIAEKLLSPTISVACPYVPAVPTTPSWRVYSGGKGRASMPHAGVSTPCHSLSTASENHRKGMKNPR
jgi:hypothetical protein